MFAGAEKLEGLYFGCNTKTTNKESKLTRIGSHAFYNCKNLDYIRRFRDTIRTHGISLPKCLTSIGSYAFSHCEKLPTMSTYAKEIGEYAFESSFLHYVTFNNDIINLGKGILSNCNYVRTLRLKSLSGNNMSVLKSIPDTIKDIYVSEGTEIPDNAFYGRTALQSVSLTESINKVGDNAFAGCSNLNHVSVSYNNYNSDNEFWNTILIGTGNTPLYDALAKRSIEVNSKITKQPTDVIVPYGELVSYSVEAKGDGLTYQWQYSYDNGITWKNTSAASGKTANLKFLLEGSNKSRLYRCKITDRYGKDITSNSVSLTVIHPLEITSQPADVTVSSGEYVSYTVNATGDKLTYQWQYSYDNGETWKDTSAATGKTANLNFYLNGSKKNRLYRCMITDQYGQTKFSSSAKLLVITK